MAKLTFAEKMGLIRVIADEIISFPAFRYRKLKDLLKLCADPKDVDVVLKAVAALCDVFCDIIPSYRIRQYNKEDLEKEKDQHGKISKDTEAIRQQEQFILECYKKYLQCLEVFSKVKTTRMLK